MALQLRLIEAFAVVADELSYTRASITTGLSETVLSKSIRQLEDELGAKLLRRGGPRGLTLTEFGEHFLARSASVGTAHNQLVELADRMARGVAGCVTIGWTGHGLGRLGVELLRRLAHELPEIELATIHPDLDGELSALDEGRCDLLLVRRDIEDVSVVTSRPFAVEPRVLGVAGGTDLAGADDVGLEALRGLVVIPSGHFTHTPAGDIWGSYPVGVGGRELLTPARAAATVDELFGRVAGAEGVCVVPEALAEFYRPDGVAFVPLYDVEPSLARWAWLAQNANPAVPAVLPVILDLAAAAPDLGGLRISR